MYDIIVKILSIIHLDYILNYGIIVYFFRVNDKKMYYFIVNFIIIA